MKYNLYSYILLYYTYFDTFISLGLATGIKMLLIIIVLCGLSAAVARKNGVDDSGRSDQNK